MSKPEKNSSTYYTRFPLDQRIEHLLFLISFSILGITGLAQKYYDESRDKGFERFLNFVQQTECPELAPGAGSPSPPPPNDTGSGGNDNPDPNHGGG